LVCDRFGSPNNAYYFDGQSYIEIPDAIDLQFGPTDNFSVSGWIKFSIPQPDFAGIFVKGPTDINRPGFQMAIYNGTYAMAEATIPQNDFIRIIDTSELNDCNWHFIATTVSMSSKLLTLYIDGSIQQIANFDTL